MNEDLFQYLLRQGDNSLIIGQRLSELCGHGPILEEDIAITNFALDFIGQATALYGYAAQVEGKNRNEDALAFQRNERDFFNALLVEQPNRDFAHLIVRQFFFDVYQQSLFGLLAKSKDALLAGLAVKFLKEVNYHLRHSTDWLNRLGDGTALSHEKTQTAVDQLWKYTEDLFAATDADQVLVAAGIAPPQDEVRTNWIAVVKAAFEKATLTVPGSHFQITGSRAGRHTEHFGFLLAEMQYLPRIYPDAQW